jgi:erythromycin esterase
MQPRREPLGLILLLTTILGAQDKAKTSQPPRSERDSRVEWLSKNAIPVRSIDPEDDNFADLMPLKKLIGNARVVQLGEASHNDGAAFYAKSRLVRFLHEQMGFDVLAWESGFFDCEEVNRKLASDMPIRHAIGGGILPIWSRSGHLVPLFEYARSTLKTDRPLRLTGVDINESASLDRLFDLVEAMGPGLVPPADRKAIEGWWVARSPSYRPKDDEIESRQAAIERLLGLLRSKATTAKDPGELLLFCKTLENIAALDELQSYHKKMRKPGTPALDPNFRDIKMGENLLWLAKTRYAGRKIIVWAATSHSARNLTSVDTRRPEFKYDGYVTMGDVIQRELDAAVYTIAFTAFQGAIGNPIRNSSNPLPGPQTDSLEAMLHESGKPYSFLDVRALAPDHWLRKPTFAQPLGHTQMLSAWANNLNAFFFIDTTFPSSEAGNVPVGVKTKDR